MPVGETWTFAELFEGLDPAPSFVSELERLGLLRVVARDGKGEPLYAEEAKEQLDRVLELVDLGYQPKDIAAIAKRVGLPQKRRRRLFSRQPTYIRMAELARRSGVEESQLVKWHAQGVLQAALVTESGEPMFSMPSIEGVRALQDLLLFGFEEDTLAEWSKLARALEELHDHAREDKDGLVDEDGSAARATHAVEQAAKEIRERLDRLRTGIRRWDKLVNGYDKRIERVRKAYDVPAPKPRKKGRRKRLRTRRRPRPGQITTE